VSIAKLKKKVATANTKIEVQKDTIDTL